MKPLVNVDGSARVSSITFRASSLMISSPSCLSKSDDAYKWERVLLSSKND